MESRVEQEKPRQLYSNRQMEEGEEGWMEGLFEEEVAWIRGTSLLSFRRSGCRFKQKERRPAQVWNDSHTSQACPYIRQYEQ